MCLNSSAVEHETENLWAGSSILLLNIYDFK